MKETIAKASAKGGAQNRSILVVSDSVAVAEAMVGSLPFPSVLVRALDDGAATSPSESEPALAIVVAFDPATAAAGIRRLRHRWRAIRVLVVGLENDESSIVRTLELGASGIVTRHESLDELRLAAEEVMAGHFRAPPELMRPLFERLVSLSNGARSGERSPLVRLSAREVDVLGRLARGESNKDIAAQMHVEVQTVKNHVGHILVRVPASGHVDLLYSADARRAVLEWLQETLDLKNSPALSSARLGWIWVGLAAIIVYLLVPRAAVPLRADEKSGRSAIQYAGAGFLFLIVWAVAALATPHLARVMSAFPVQQDAVFAGAMFGPAAALAGVGVLLGRQRREAFARLRGAQIWSVLLAAMRGALPALAVIVALQLLLIHHYETALDLNRVALWASFVVVALPLFFGVEMWLRWVSAGHTPLLELACLLVAASITAVTSVLLLERMSKAPGCVLAAVLVLYAAHRFGTGSQSFLTPVMFGAVLLGRVAASACAFY